MVHSYLNLAIVCGIVHIIFPTEYYNSNLWMVYRKMCN